MQAGEVTQAVRDSIGRVRADRRRRLDRARRATGSSSRRRARSRRRSGCSISSSTPTASSRPCSSAPTPASHDTERLREHLGLEHPHVELEVHAGDQPLYPYLIGVEVASVARDGHHAARAARPAALGSQGGRAEARRPPRDDGVGVGARSARALPAPLSRPHAHARHRRARDR